MRQGADRIQIRFQLTLVKQETGGLGIRTSPQESNMHGIKEASQDFAADFASLREDITKLTSSVSELARAQASATASTVMDTVESAQQKFSEGASEAQNRLRGAGSDIEAMIERNPLVAMLAALSAGLLIGMMSGTRR
jgi:ElaB/YqjD/DUF883 family membrane-anchored ribosome-binding protein